MTLIMLFATTLFVAYSNGANDNFKGVATLFGSNAASYRTAIALATITTLAGSLSSVILAESLVTAFSGRGLVPDAVASSPEFLLAVASGAGATIILATVLGLPVSTTHGLTGALVGAGAIAAGDELKLGMLGAAFFAPLLISPMLAAVIVVPLYKVLRELTSRLRITKETSVCIGEAPFASASPVGDAAVIAASRADHSVTIGQAPGCIEEYAGQVYGVSLQRLVNACHYLSASAVSFARGLNDTPKIVGLIFVVQAFNVRFGTIAIAVAMAIGGLLNARKVAHTMSKKIARLNEEQAFTANLVTAFLVIFASRLGLPVSTTHVSVGAIAGTGIVNGSTSTPVLSGIVLSWVLTLPLAAMISAAAYFALQGSGG